MYKTVREAHEWAFSILSARGLEKSEARFSAERLVRHVLHWDRARFFAYGDRPFPKGQRERLRQLVEKRAARVPLQHLIGCQEFYGRLFRVSPDVLIPRPETEGLVEAVLREGGRVWGKGPCDVVDVGTGSGAIAVTLAAENPGWQVTAVDCSSAALQMAEQNALDHGVRDNIRFVCGDLLTPLLSRGERVDIVVSNPPYIPTEAITHLAKEVKTYEPPLALDGGRDGLALYRRLTAMLPQVIKREKGLVALEVGAGQSERVAALCQEALPWGAITVERDLAGIERVVIVRWS